MLMFSRDDSIPQSLSSFFFLNNQKNGSAARSYFGCSRNSNNLYAKDERNLGEWKKKKSLYLHLYFCILFTLFDFCHSRHARLATEWVTRYAQAKQTAAIFPFQIFVVFFWFFRGRCCCCCCIFWTEEPKRRRRRDHKNMSVTFLSPAITDAHHYLYDCRHLMNYI